MFRKLRADEIECRVATVSEKGCSLLLYKDARVDMNILDEAFGVFGWQRKHEVIDGRLYCTVSVFDKNMDTWVSKQDVGVESYTEKEKGQASDSFKRACFNWGIGRELYTAPFIWIKAGDVEIIQKKNGSGYTTYDRFNLSEIGYDDKGKINLLSITNKDGKTVYTFGKKKSSQKSSEPKKSVSITKKEADILATQLSERQIEQWLSHFKKGSLEQLTAEEAGNIKQWIRQLKEKQKQAEALKEKVDANESKTA